MTRRELPAACGAMCLTALPLLAGEPKGEADPFLRKDVPMVTIEEVLKGGWGKHLGKQVVFTATITNTEIPCVRIDADEKGRNGWLVRLHGPAEYSPEAKGKRVRVCGLIVDQPQYGVASVWFYRGEFAKDKPAEPAKAKSPAPGLAGDNPYRAYWLKYPPKEGNQTGYGLLLITRWPIEKLSGFKKGPGFGDKGPGRPGPVLDEMAFTFIHHAKDSLWLEPFHLIKEFGKVDAKSVTADGVTYEYEPCALADVVRLLDQPLGKGMLHRPHHPLDGAWQTAKAFRMLLLDQIKNEK